MEERQDLQQTALSPEVIHPESSNQLKEPTLLNKYSPLSNTEAPHNTTTSQIAPETLQHSDKEKKQVTLIEQEKERNTDSADSSSNPSMTLIAQKKIQEDVIQRGYNSIYKDLPTTNPIETLATIHAHYEKQMQGFSEAYLEAKGEVDRQMVQEIGNKTICFSSATSSSPTSSLEMKAPIPILPSSGIRSTVSSKSAFLSPIKSNRLFIREIRNFLNKLEDIYKKDQDIHELREEINVLIGGYSNRLPNLTKEERDKIREKMEEIYPIQEEIESNLPSTNRLHSLPTTALVGVSAHENRESGSSKPTTTSTSDLPSLSAFLTKPSTWSALARQPALFLYNETNGIALLRLGIQAIEIPLHLHPNPFLILSHELWGGNLHTIAIEEISKQQAQNPLFSVTQNSRNFASSGGVVSKPISPRLELEQVLKTLIEDSITKKYCFQLTRTNAFVLKITLVYSKESPFAVRLQLDILQKEMEVCLQAANLKNYICKRSGKEILKVTGDKEVIDALADLLVRQGLSIELAETHKYYAFFKAEQAPEMEDMSTLICPMQ